ncbi:hypothetical protein E4M00_01445 [Leifsonia flava]|uniref:DUF6984 domain-containing protein n=2 Tax=Orlajensenia leifsoniae TaxID=2561933 RepID=A0A4Y9R9E7_9MICO|nr:hypothetical protein [Leifsonia flava]TFV99895.1 hypothetical protein E4M00_01445 [Leifsonia flava]
MDDGQMGSLLVLPPGLSADATRRFGREVAELRFMDGDGVLISAALNVDSDGNLFELDMFKGDGSPLIRIPDALLVRLSIRLRAMEWCDDGPA